MDAITTQSIVPCRCGQMLSDLKEINDDSGGKQKFFTQRCEQCGVLTVIRSDGVVMASH